MSKPKKPGTGVTNRRRKELAAAKQERQSARRAERATRRRRRQQITWGVLALLGVLIIGAFALWPSTDPADVAQPAPTAAASAAASASPVDIGCDPAPAQRKEPMTFEKAPKQQLDKGGEYTLTLQTNCGDITIETLPGAAPKTVNSMLWLASKGYFDATLCHRLTTEGIYVLQCGDPEGTGAGGPGYTLPDENLPKAGDKNYPAGTIAMANAGPGTSGSQFFIVYKDTALPPDYTIWGKVSSGLDVVKKVADAGVAGGGTDGKPAADIGIVATKVDPTLG